MQCIQLKEAIKMYKIQVPATSANLGLGFDSMGIALSKFLTIEADLHTHWKFDIQQEELATLPLDSTNLIAQTACQVAKHLDVTMPNLYVKMKSEIPLTHGLGSSSSAIVAGIELMNHFCQLDLTQTEKIQLASQIEGHPDNVGPCITGGVFIGAMIEGLVYYQTLKLPEIGIVLSVPPYEVSTELARKALPDSYQRSIAIQQNALNNVLVMAMQHADFDLMGQLMMQDAFHEIYRQSLIPELAIVRSIGQQLKTYATVISGAGPTLLTLCEKENTEKVLQSFQEQIPQCHHEISSIFYHDIKVN